MSRDSILGWTLTLLVVISLFLSFTIWSQVPGDLSAFKVFQEQKKIDLVSVVSPEKILVYLGNSFHTMLKSSSPMYDKTWNLSRKLLTSQWTTSSEPVDTVNREYFIHKKGLEVFLPTSLPFSVIKQLFNINIADTSNLDGKLIDSLILIDDEGLVGYLVDSSGKFYQIGKNETAKELNSLISEINDSNPPLFASLPADINLKVSRQVYISLLSYELPVFSLKKEQILEENLASKFFTDFSITRRIEERDGTVIYTDGLRGLRIYDDDVIEYNFPIPREQRKNVSFLEALKTAVDFVATHGGWPKDGYLASYDVKRGASGKTYLFKFKFRVNGFPVVNLDNFLDVTVEGTQVKSFFRSAPISVKQQGVSELMTPIEALDTAVATKNIKTISDIYPGYVIKDDMLQPVWVVKSSGMEVIIQDISE